MKTKESIIKDQNIIHYFDGFDDENSNQVLSIFLKIVHFRFSQKKFSSLFFG